MKLSDVLDEIAAKNGLTTNRALANFIGINERRIPEYYNGREPMDDDYALIAMASKRRIDELQAIVKLATEKNEKSRGVWEKYYKSIGGLAASIALVFFLVVNLIVTPTPAETSERGTSTPKYFVLCKIMALKIISRIVAFVQHTPAIFVPRWCFSG